MNLAELQHAFRDWLVLGDESAAWRLGGGPGTMVYQNNYRVALVEALAETFKRLAAWLGDEAFETLAARYIDAHPPHSWTLDAHGERLPAFAAGQYPFDPEVADLAAIDWEVGQAFVAADAEAIGPDALDAVDWDSAVIHPVPSLACLSLHSNAEAIWQAIAAEETPPAAEQREAPATLLVWRQGFEPVFRLAEPAELAMLAACRRGESFAQVCATLGESMTEEEAVTAAGTVLGRWLGEGMVAAIA